MIETHVKHGGRSESRTPTAPAIEHELPILAEHRFVIGTVGVYPEFQHASSGVECTRDHALPFEFTWVSKVHERDRLGVGEERLGFIDAEAADPGRRLGHQLLGTFGDRHELTVPGRDAPRPAAERGGVCTPVVI